VSRYNLEKPPGQPNNELRSSIRSMVVINKQLLFVIFIDHTVDFGIRLGFEL